jgi:hypothetical protein
MPAAAQEIVGALDDGWHFSERVACYEVPLLRETFWPSLSFPARAEVLLDEYQRISRTDSTQKHYHPERDL